MPLRDLFTYEAGGEIVEAHQDCWDAREAPWADLAA